MTRHFSCEYPNMPTRNLNKALLIAALILVALVASAGWFLAGN